MKTVLKIVVYIIDMALTPIRAILGLEVVITGAILSDTSIKETITVYLQSIRQYPMQLKEATKIIFEKD